MLINQTNQTEPNPASSGALQGIRVIDLSLLLPGPLCSQHLGDMGADVIKIENPRMPDLIRMSGSRVNAKSNPDHSETGMFMALNRNKRAMTLNIKRPEGRELLMKLLADADVLLEGFRPGTLEEMGIGYRQLHNKFPRLIYCAISGYGDSGPYRDMAGHDGNYIALSGILDSNGAAGEAPIVPGMQFADTIGGSMLALSSILAALFYRERSGQGQFLDISMMDGAFAAQPLQLGQFFASQRVPQRGREMLNGGLPNYQVYECRDGKYVMLAALEERFLRVFLTKMNREDIIQDFNFKKDDPAQLRPALKELFSQKDRSEFAELFLHPDCCLSPVNNLAEAMEDAQLQSRGMIQEVEHPEFGHMKLTGSPYRFSESPCTLRHFPPTHGEHTKEILSELGISPEQQSELKQKRII